MKITLICNEYPPRPQGGIGTFVYYLSRELLRKGHDITVAGMWDRNTEVDDDGIHVITRACANESGHLRQRRAFVDWLKSDCRSKGTHIVEVPDFEGMLPYRLDNCCPAVVRLHMSATALAVKRRTFVSPALIWSERETLRQHRSWIGVSEWVLNCSKALFRLRPEISDVIYNFAPPMPVHNSSHATTRPYGRYVLFVGKLSASKGALDLARAANIFLRAVPDLNVVYVGRDTTYRGAPVSAVIRKIVGQPLSARVHFLGGRPQAEIGAWMSAAEVYVAPSHIESFGLTVVEAQAVGVPVIYSRRSAGPEIIRHGSTGILIEPTDYRSIAEAVLLLVAKPELRRFLVQNGQKDIRERFTIGRCAEESLAFYEHTLTRTAQLR
jgi:glycosyltransferase involved in cell wall biosynthesis